MKNKELVEKIKALFSTEKQVENTELTLEDLASQIAVIGESLINFDERLAELSTQEENVEETETPVAETEETIVEETETEESDETEAEESDETETENEEPTAEVETETTEPVVNELEVAMAKITELEEKLTELSKQPVVEPTITDSDNGKPETFASIMMAKMADKRKGLH